MDKEKTKKKYCNLSELARALDTPRRTLISWQEHNLLLPLYLTTRKLYHRQESIKTIDLFKKEMEKGFNRKFAAMNVKENRKYKTAMKRIKSHALKDGLSIKS